MIRKRHGALIPGVIVAGVLSGPVLAEEPSVEDVVYARVGSHELKLDLYLPKETRRPPLVVFFHGGGWRNHDHKRCFTTWLTEYGFAVASVGYRLSDAAKFPAQIHDCKAAIRWLRAHADKYGYNAEQIGATGSSAGAHLATLLGVSGDHRELEGVVGEFLDQSSRVQAVVSYWGAYDIQLFARDRLDATELPGGSVYQLLGGPVSQNRALAELVSPTTHVSPDDPPLLILHGSNDGKVPRNQSFRMLDEYAKVHCDATLTIVPGAGHGGDEYFKGAYREQAARFFRVYLTRPSPE